MPVQLKISFAHSALSDLEEVLEFYNEKKISHFGERLVQTVFKDIKLLSEQPDIGKRVPVFQKTPFTKKDPYKEYSIWAS
jgi:toxin ParE1/3/4